MSSPDVTPYISVVSPVYRAEQIVPELVLKLKAALSTVTENFELVLVEDCGPDNSWQKLLEQAAIDERVRVFKLSRNFGQHAAITAGLSESRGDFVAVIDCDLQQAPSDIPRLIAEAEKGYDVVFTRRTNRSSTAGRTFGARLFHIVFAFLTDQVRTNYDESTLTLLSRKVVNAFLTIPDKNRHFLIMLKWLGFRSSHIEIEHHDRHSGESSYNWPKLIRHAVDGIVSSSTTLLSLSIIAGFAFCGLAVLLSALLIALYFLHGLKEGWASLAVLILLSTGMILSSLGIVGLYLGKTFEQAKGRPLFIISERGDQYPEAALSERRSRERRIKSS